MTKDKIVINVPMHNDKAKSKAMKIAVAIQGVMSVSVGEESDRLEVIGEGVDSVCLVLSLRKKFCFAKIISQEEVKPAVTESSSPSSPNSSPPPSSPPKHYLPPPPPYCHPVYFESRIYDAPPPNCSIM